MGYRAAVATQSGCRYMDKQMIYLWSYSGQESTFNTHGASSSGRLFASIHQYMAIMSTGPYWYLYLIESQWGLAVAHEVTVELTMW